MSLVLASRKSRALCLLWLAELVMLVLAHGVVAWVLPLDPSGGAAGAPAFSTTSAFAAAIVATMSMAALGLYQVHVRHSRRELAVRLVLAFAFAGFMLALLGGWLPRSSAAPGAGGLVATLALGLVGVATLRAVLHHVIRTDVFRRRVLVLGAGANADLINTRLRRESDRHAITVVGFVPLPGQPVHVPDSMLLRTDFALPELAEWLHVFEIVIAPDERRGALPMQDMLTCAQRGISMTSLSTFFEREAGMVKLDVADPSWLAFSGGFDHSVPRRLVKRFFDLVAATVLLVVALPVMLVVTACIALESGRPILYRQTRVGENGRGFELVKFRSMRADAEADGVARWASREDDRSTRFGRFLRATRLDELPQVFNVLRGHMSFVGPRPERPQFVDMLSREVRYYDVRHCVKPGITGWAQLRYPYGASVHDAEEKLTFDLFYVKNHGLVLDLLILLQTVEVVLFRRGAR
ncbi:TIGR03013 family PEP-CTERM/XrtA system glycosyltransferase [Luteimonas pelagia]